jgi:hypothetical protein
MGSFGYPGQWLVPGEDTGVLVLLNTSEYLLLQ